MSGKVASHSFAWFPQFLYQFEQAETDKVVETAAQCNEVPSPLAHITSQQSHSYSKNAWKRSLDRQTTKKKNIKTITSYTYLWLKKPISTCMCHYKQKIGSEVEIIVMAGSVDPSKHWNI